MYGKTFAVKEDNRDFRMNGRSIKNALPSLVGRV